MKSATLLQLLAGTVSLTAAKPCKKLAPFPSAGFHTTKFDDALTAAANDPGFHEYITGLTKLFDVQPGKTYKLTPEGTLAETRNATDNGTGLIITHDGTVPKLVIGGQTGVTVNVTLGLGLNITLPGLGLPIPGVSGGSYTLNPLPLPTLSLPPFPPLLPPFGATPTTAAGSTPSGFGNGTIASSSSSSAVSSTASAALSSTASSAAGTTTSSGIASSTASAVASSTASSTSSAAATPTASAGCTSPETFIEWRSMQEADKKSYVQAVRCL